MTAATKPIPIERAFLLYIYAVHNINILTPQQRSTLYYCSFSYKKVGIERGEKIDGTAKVYSRGQGESSVGIDYYLLL